MSKLRDAVARALEALIRIQEITDLLGVSRRTYLRTVRLGLLPPPVRFNCRVHFWNRDEVLAAIAKLVKEGGVANG
jgi:predicted DNA-binding transcriptional regulator AlpA